MKMKDLSGTRYGKLLVLWMNKRECNKITGKMEEISYHCICDCGTECDVPGRILRTGNHKTCGCRLKGLDTLDGHTEKITISNEKIECKYTQFFPCTHSKEKRCCFNCDEFDVCEMRCLNSPRKCGSKIIGGI